MHPEGVVLCSGGLRIAQRGAGPIGGAPALRVGEVRAITRPRSSPVEAHRSDEVIWRRHWLEETRLVIEFVDLAVVEVDDTSGVATFDCHLPDGMEQHLLFDHVLPLVLARNGALVLHGGVISRDGMGAVLIGSSGAGKSTLTAFAWQHGWTVGGDDGAVLFPTEPAMAEPTYATVRITPGSADLLGIDAGSCSAVAGKLRLTGEGDRAFRQEPVELRLVCIIQPVPAGEPSRFEPLGGIDAHSELFGSTFHAELSGGRLLPAIVEGLASIAETTIVGRLDVPRGVDGLAAAERVLREHLGAQQRPATQTLGADG